MRLILGPVPCHACGVLLIWARADDGWPAAWIELDGEAHICSRARAKRYNGPVGNGDESNSIAPDARQSAITREVGVAAVEVMAR